MNKWEGPVPFGGVGMIFSVGFFKTMNRMVTLEVCVGGVGGP